MHKPKLINATHTCIHAHARGPHTRVICVVKVEHDNTNVAAVIRVNDTSYFEGQKETKPKKRTRTRRAAHPKSESCEKDTQAQESGRVTAKAMHTSNVEKVFHSKA